jgi:O-antigen/teichoic acid export membrane protein
MSNHIKSIKLKIKNNNSIIENVKYIAALQGFNLLVPFLIYPYIIRIIGSETYGLIIFIQSIISYFVTLIGFGFNITATKDVSFHRNNREKLNEIFSSILILKGILFAVCIIAFVLYFFVSGQTIENPLLFCIMFYLCIYEWLFPFWYFQGIEKMKYITYISIASRFLLLLLILVFVKTKDDYLFYPILSALGCFLSIFIAFYIIIKKHRIYFILPSFQTLKYYFNNSTSIFASNFVLKIYTNSNKVIVGSLLGMENLAFYDLAEKFLNALKIPISSLSQAIFPNLSFNFNQKLVKKLFKYSIITTLIMIIVFIFFVKKIIVIYAGQNMLGATNASVILILSYYH